MIYEIEPFKNFSLSYNYDFVQNIDVLDFTNLTYNFFFHNFMLPNIPCIIKGISADWECSKLWVKPDDKINTEYLQNKYGSEKVSVYNCMERYYNSQKCNSIIFKDYFSKSGFLKGQYLKNWHLKLNHKPDNFYEVPIFFASDWLNEFYLENLPDDYRFVYMGSEDTWTPFHVDVFTSFSWSVNICGRKKWLLLPPGEEEFIKDELGNLPYDLMLPGSKPSECKYCDIISNRKYVEVIQNPGEAIFVPSGWHHEVWNLDDTISVNHNWVNGCNIQNMYKSLISNLVDIKKEIADCKEMDNFENHCQVMLNTLFGMDFKTFYEFLKFIARRRLQMLKQENISAKLPFHNHTQGKNHILFDIKSIKEVLDNFVKCQEVKTLDFGKADEHPQYLLSDIVKALE